MLKYLYLFEKEIASLENNKIKNLKAIFGEHAPFAIAIANTVYSPIRNHRGDIVTLLHEEKLISTYRFSSFGEFEHTGNVQSPWLFSSQRYDEQLKVYHYFKRLYDPSLGVWLTPDPLNFADGPNLYAYVHNNPLIYIDPYGLWSEYFDSVREGFYNVVSSPRFQGGCQMLNGAAEMTAGMAFATSTYGWGAPLGFAAGTHGADRFVTGLNTLINGVQNDTATSHLMQHMGVPRDIANNLSFGFISL